MKLIAVKDRSAVVDDDDYELLRKYRWTLANRKRGLGAYAKATIEGKPVLMHRLILGLSSPSEHSDHKNRIGLDNRRDNLRRLTHAQNQQNKSPQRNSRTGVRGVWFEPSTKRFIAQVILHRKRVYRQRFHSFDEAVAAVKQARIRLLPYALD